MKAQVASLYQAVDLQQEIPPLIIGERANSNGSKKFRELLLADDFQACLRIAADQESRGAQVIDLCTAYAGRDESADMTTMVRLCARALKAPLMLDSTTPACIKACLQLYPGRPIINSVNLEDGGHTLRQVCRLAKRYGAAVVALTIDESGMAMQTADKLRVARRIYEMAVSDCGLSPQDLLFDCLTFTVGSGDPKLNDAAIQTLEAIRRLKSELPGCLAVLGLSNISFGLKPAARQVLNSVFLHEAVAAGLDAAIVDAAKIVPLASIAADERELSLDLLYNRQRGEESPLMLFIKHFAGREQQAEAAPEEQDSGPEEQLFRKVMQGDKEGLDDLLAILRGRMPPLAIINQLLVPAMRRVGELFGKGEILLPFVLQSAEVMKNAVTLLEPFMDKNAASGGPVILLATVQGDVHDIGKNLADIILSNNGYTVHNIGIKIPAETIIQKARETKADIIGLSGLLVKSAIVMQESLAQFGAAGLRVPVLLGGAALTTRFVAENCVPAYPAPVVYCGDAFAGLKAVQDFEAGKLVATSWSGVRSPKDERGEAEELEHGNPVPKVPFWGARYVDDIDPEALFARLNRAALFRGRWGYRRAKMTEAEYRDLLDHTVEPLYERLRQETLDSGWIRARIAYGYFHCHAEGETLTVEDQEQRYLLDFPRQKGAPHRCIADYFKGASAGGDVAAFFVATIGPRFATEITRLYRDNAYHDYLMLHGLSVELTDALAEYWHDVVKTELGLPAGHQGGRFGFGYTSCPNLELQQPVFALLKPENIGVSLSENMQMIPEQSTSAIVVHHPQARYFAV